MDKKVFVTLWNLGNGADVLQESLYIVPTVKQALIDAIMQYKGNYSTWDYPKDIEGIEESHVIKGRLNYSLTEDLIFSAQEA